MMIKDNSPLEFTTRLSQAVMEFKRDFKKEPSEILLNPKFITFVFPFYSETRNIEFVREHKPIYMGVPVNFDGKVEYVQIV